MQPEQECYVDVKVGKTDLRFRKCLKEEERQRHCTELIDNGVMIGSTIPKYEDLFSADVDKVEVIGRNLLQKYHSLSLSLIRLVLLHDFEMD